MKTCHNTFSINFLIVSQCQPKLDLYFRFAFVDFKSAEAAAEAFDSMNGQAIDGRQVTLDFAADKGSGGGGGGYGSPRGGRGK